MEPEPGLAAPDFVRAALPPARDPLSRYRGLQVASILLAVGGFAMVVAAIILGSVSQPSQDRALLLALLAGGGGLAAVIGLLMNAVRAIVVREALPPTRYRGPAVFVLLAIATVLSTIASVTIGGALVSLATGGEISIGASFVLLTVTQAGLLAVAIMFVAVPNALPGVRLLPARGGIRSFAIGLFFALPAWIAATLLGVMLATLLEALGHPVQPGIVDDAVARLDPTVLVLAIVLVAPVAEEIFFRGVVLNAWLREYGERTAIVGSAALFAAIHADVSGAEALLTSIARVLPIFGLGLALAFVYRRTGSLLGSIGLHTGFNALSIAVAMAQRLGLLGPIGP